jgi:hypothetical protein
VEDRVRAQDLGFLVDKVELGQVFAEFYVSLVNIVLRAWSSSVSIVSDYCRLDYWADRVSIPRQM